MVVYRILDTAQHHFWKYFDPSLPFYDSHGAKKYGDTILKMYQKMDSAVGEVLKEIPDDVNIIVHSDHGFAGANFGPWHLNDFLSSIGTLSLPGEAGKKRSLIRLARGSLIQITKKSLNKLIDFADKYSIGNFRQFLKSRFPKLLTSMAAEKYYPNIVWGNSKAYSPRFRPEVWINLKGREPKGIVDKEEYDKLCDFIIDCLYEWRAPKTKEKVIEAAWKRSGIYHGDSVERAADIILRFRDGVDVTGIDFSEKYKRFRPKGTSPRGKGFEGFIFGQHADNGLIIMKGKNIKRGQHLEGCNIVDLAPTILHMMGEEVLSDMDGKVIIDAIDETFMNNNEIQYCEAGKESGGVEKSTYSEDDSNLVKNRLKDLGYVE
jgi:predicted AlkP superfamily phosphohydrolase/phosphomutase